MTDSNMRLFLNYLVVAVLAISLVGCATDSGAGPKAPTVGAVGAQAPDDLIRKGDSLAVRLSGVPANDQGIYEVQVDESGNISMPYIGNIQAGGLTSVALKQRIESAYRERGIFPTCNIQIFTRETRFVNVNGEVRSPQRLAYTRDLTLAGAISACGGFTEYANRSDVKILRNGQSYSANMKEILKNPTLDVPLQPNDVVQVNRSIW